MNLCYFRDGNTVLGKALIEHNI